MIASTSLSAKSQPNIMEVVSFSAKQEVNNFRAGADMYYKVSSPDDGNRISSSVLKVWFLFQFADLVTNSVWDIIMSYKT